MSHSNAHPMQAPNDGRSHIFVNQKNRIKLVPVDDIYYFKAEDKYITIKTIDKEYMITDTLNKLEEMLGDHFIRIHRNALISTRYVDGLEKNSKGCWCVLFIDIADRLEISRRQAPVIRRWLKSGVSY